MPTLLREATTSPIVRPDGITVRPAATHELEAVRSLIAGRLGPINVPLLDRAFDDPRPGAYQTLVAVDTENGRVVGAMGLHRQYIRVGPVRVPAGHLDFGATARQYEGRGIMADLLHLTHAISAARGDLVQFLFGIPVYYRRFGYQRAILMPSVHYILPEDDLEMPEGWSVRLAAPGDIAAIMALQDSIAARADLSVSRDREVWEGLVAAEIPQTIVAIHRDKVHGYARRLIFPSGSHLSEVAADTASAVRALLADTRSVSTHTVRVVRRPGTALDAALTTVGLPETRRHKLHVRVTDPVAVLKCLRPTLSSRLAASAFADYTGNVLLALFRTGIAIECDRGTVTAVREVPAREALDDQDSSDIDADMFPSLVFGPEGAVGLEHESEDINLGEQRGILDALFPPLKADTLLYLI